MNVVTRFAPSPTGNLNIGGWRSGYFAYLFARHTGGKFILRIEDTDKERSKKEFEENILETLKWLGTEPDEIYRQSDNLPRHKEVLQKLLDRDLAYVSKEEPKEEGERSEVIRFRNPGKKVTFEDLVHGSITFDTTELGDFVIAKSMEEPIFHFALAVDDWDEGVTYVIRGEDHISNTPRQILIQEAIGAPRPAYAHLPLILGKDRTKLSKRKGAKAITEYRDMGYLPQAILNYDAFLGWHPGGAEADEVFMPEELIQHFTLEQVQKSPAIFDDEKLAWFNRQHILKLAPETFAGLAEKFLSPATVKGLKEKNVYEQVVPLMRERIQTLGELGAMDADGEWAYFAELSAYDFAKLVPKNSDAGTTMRHLSKVLEFMKSISGPEWHDAKVKEKIWPYAEQEGKGAVLWPTRFALSGREKSPDPFVIAGIIGKDESEARIKRALEALGG